jgi:hypothetical protein
MRQAPIKPADGTVAIRAAPILELELFCFPDEGIDFLFAEFSAMDDLMRGGRCFCLLAAPKSFVLQVNGVIFPFG